MSDDTLWLRIEQAHEVWWKYDNIIEQLASAEGTVTVDDLTSEMVSVDVIEHKLERLYEHDIVEYESHPDPSEMEVELVHDTIRVMPLLLDGSEPTVPEVIQDAMDGGSDE